MAEWDVDLTEVNGLRDWYRGQPKMIQKGGAMLLNRYAWGTRDESVKQIGRLMVVRNLSFVNSRLRVTQCSMSTPIDRQQAIAGSIAGKRFSGWTEQELGTPTSRKRVSTLASRAGDISRQMLPRTRLKPTQQVATFGSQGYGKTPRGTHGGNANYGGWIAMLVRQGYKGLVRIKGGLYMIDRGGKILAGPKPQGGGRGSIRSTGHLSLVQEMKKKQPKANHWLIAGRNEYFRKNPPQRTWIGIVSKLMNPPRKK